MNGSCLPILQITENYFPFINEKEKEDSQKNYTTKKGLLF